MLQLESTWHVRNVDHVLTYSGRKIVVRSQKTSRNTSGFDAPITVVLAWEERGSCLNIFRTTNRDQISETFMNYEAKYLLRKSVDHVLTYSGRQIAVGSLKPSRITREKTCCVSELNTSVRVVFANRSGFDAPIRVVLAWMEPGSCLNIFRTTNRGQISETFTNYEAKDLLRNRISEPYTNYKAKDLLRNESNTSVRVVFANRSGFDAPIAVVMAWEERGSSLDIFRMTNRGRISESFTNYEAKDLRQIAVGSQKPLRIMRQKTCCASESNTSIRVVFANRSGFDAPIGVLLAWEERGSCFKIYQITNHGWISETFTNYEAKDLLRKLGKQSSWHGSCVDNVLTYSGRQISVGSQKPPQITRQKTCCANESNTSVRVVLTNRSCFDAPIGVVLTWEESESCLNLFQMTNHGWISETFTNYEAKDLLRNVDHVLTYSGRKIAVESQKPSRSTRQKTYCASESNKSVRVVFANRSGFDAPIGVLLAWEERGSCLNIYQITNRVDMAWEERGSCIKIFWMTNHGQISETFTNYEAKDLLRKSHHEFVNYSGFDAPIGVILACEECGFANRSGFDAKIAVFMAWEERRSCINIFRTTNRGRISETFLNYEAKDLLRKSQKPSRMTRQKTCCASESNTSIRVLIANRSGFDAPIGVVLAWEERGSFKHVGTRCISNRSGFDAKIAFVMAWEERGSCLDIIWTTNSGRIPETFMNHEAKDLLRKSHHEFVNYSGFDAPIGVILACEECGFANRSGFDAKIAVVMAWEERGSCINIFRTTNRGRISETFLKYEAKDLLRKSVDHVLTYYGRKIAVGSQKPSRITRQKTCCASESNTSIRVLIANRSGFDAPIGVVLAWEERGSSINIFRTKNCGRISETFTNYEAKDLMLDMAWEERGSCIIIFWMTNHGRISETFTNYEAKELLRNVSNTSVSVVFANRSGFDAPIGVVLAWGSVDHVLKYSRRQIAVESQKTLLITRQKTCCAIESNTSVRVVFANRSGFDAPIGVVLAWEERGSCLNIFG
ncbi:uncharacterized protein G2W53_041739 [Senna tora]|uniref:Uncharacterized protein n=1 Tax=Senna tora TaxID=362788 RepID=A0A834SF95_9FABA|nr:uncharacterized protein G2W53_041739 [Senna tora]